MAFLSNNWALSLKLVLISTGVLSMAVILKFSVPVMADFIVSEVPSIWSSINTWLRPPYLYILINCIIISIVASTKFQNNKNVVDETQPPSDTVAVPVIPTKTVKISEEDVQTEYAVYEGVVSNGYVYDATVEEKVPEVLVAEISDSEKKLSDLKMINGGDINQTVLKSVGSDLQRKNSVDFSYSNGNEKPLVSSRFGHRRSAKASPEAARAVLGVSRPKRNDTLESTWKTITEGRSVPLARHLKKSDTMDTHVNRSIPLPNDENTPPPKMKKSETFNEGNNNRVNSSPGSGRLKKDPSLSQDELNRRVEAFIKKFNEEMRLQRQESLNQYQEMISGGVH
ncbi:Cotton fiber (DUF761) [Quillaja saponaria]|uniref:Cotton fiber (DUF761) n=1 Tax=Quillaja saponaria TaxID=32244 RepID=A0AAD7KZ25_QUISA|nr:Cotton fiber (DUF761) [Quillaja saponaria]